jgi:hypothetical protein
VVRSRVSLGKFRSPSTSHTPNPSLLRIKVSGFASASPQARLNLPDPLLPIAKIDSITRPNGGTTIKTITAAEIKLDGKVTLSQPQGDISMGIYQ